MTVETRYEHIVLKEGTVPIIAGTTMKVIELVLAHLVYGWSPAELHVQFPHLSLGMIHSALAYYWDHQEELARDIEQRRQFAEEMRMRQGELPFVTRMKAEGKC